MKKLLALLLAGTMAFSLTACEENDTGGGGLPPHQSSGDSSSLSTDFQQYMKGAESTKVNPGCETETGWYFQYSGILYYIDKSNIKTTALCGKPDCNHLEDVTCNAFVNASSINYFDGKIYFDNADFSKSGLLALFSMNTDGTGRKEVQELQAQKQSQWKSCASIIHKDNVYFNYAGAVYTAPIGSNFKNATKLYGEVKNAEAGGSDTGDEIYWKFSAEGDKVYFMGNITQSDKTQKDTLFCYDTITKEVKQVWQIPEASEVGKWETSGVSIIQTGKPSCGWYIKNSILYFYLSGNDLWCNDLNGGKNERVAAVSEKIPESGFAIFNDNNIFIINDYPDNLETLFKEDTTKADNILVYDYDGKLIKELPLKALYEQFADISNIQMLWASDGKVMLYVYGTNVIQTEANASTARPKERLACINIDSGAISLLDWTGYYK